ncbi:heterokaryon incompatibility protein Het-C-domain-containing protein [Stachybotrys elegans]|uniref:Heterokaryon incompatibility protein Het-C-domain-containing protein n=1 Tax=Stachybotrys elegans TaxID=80388 RepID=A0A8K0WRB4_9HYPO|nr:heterokaryon incompatibility protein Het-C-domain-containing protein [Stachybotrys elegans]
MLQLQNHGFLVGLVLLVALATPAAAFGAGNIASISKVEGQNWRHGDIEDALLTLAMAQAFGGKKFNKIMVSRTYFGNWLRDYSQAIDVGTVSSVSAEAIRLLLCVLGFLTFGFGSGEFEVTADRLGCYRPEDHIDNPKNYADNKDARDYDRRLRGPIDEAQELSIDRETGMKNYIANERAGIMTSAQHCRKLFGRCIELGRRYKDRGNKSDFYESLRLMGTGLHCLEDFFAHSNYCELALIELGERDIFPHCGSNTRMELEGARGDVYPIVTGTFGGVDFLHSVTGEVSDKLTQNEVDELEGTLKESQSADTSLLRELLDKIPDGLFGGKHQSDKVEELQSNASAAQMENTSVSPRDPEEFTEYVKNIFRQVMPAIEFHDDVMKSITAAVEKIPVLPKVIEQLEEQLSRFVFSVIAPFVVPLIHQIRNELKTGSDEIIQSSEREQHIVFEDDDSTDPTHSMLSKDHFSNILNEVAGRASASMVHWVVPQIMKAIDDEGADVDRLLTRVIYGVLHHPAQRDMGRDGISEGRQRLFGVVKDWWEEKGDNQRDDYRRKLSRRGVQNGENHKEGVHDTGHGHGCVGKLKMQKLYGTPDTLEDKIAGAAADAIVKGATGAISDIVGGNRREERREEGGLGGFLNAASSFLGDALGGEDKERRERETRRHDDDDSHTRTEVEYRRDGDRYGQTQHSETSYNDGGRSSEYRQYEQRDSQDGRQTSGYGYEERTESRPTYGGYEERTERREYHSSGYTQESSYTSGGYQRQEESSYSSGGGGGGYGGGYERRDEGGYGGGGGDYGRREESSYGSGGGGYGGGDYGRRDEDSYERREEGGYGGGEGYGRRDDERRRYDDDERRDQGGYGY